MKFLTRKLNFLNLDHLSSHSGLDPINKNLVLDVKVCLNQMKSSIWRDGVG